MGGTCLSNTGVHQVHIYSIMACNRLLITGDHFPQIFHLFPGSKNRVPSGCPGETSIFKIMIDDVTLWSKLASTW